MSNGYRNLQTTAATYAVSQPSSKRKPKPATELELDLFRRGAGQPHGQQGQSLALRRGRANRLVQVVLQCSVGHAMLGGDVNAGMAPFLDESERSFYIARDERRFDTKHAIADALERRITARVSAARSP